MLHNCRKIQLNPASRERRCRPDRARNGKPRGSRGASESACCGVCSFPLCRPPRAPRAMLTREALRLSASHPALRLRVSLSCESFVRVLRASPSRGTSPLASRADLSCRAISLAGEPSPLARDAHHECPRPRSARVVAPPSVNPHRNVPLLIENDFERDACTCPRAARIEIPLHAHLKHSNRPQRSARPVRSVSLRDENDLMRHVGTSLRVTHACACRHCDLKRSNRVHAALGASYGFARILSAERKSSQTHDFG